MTLSQKDMAMIAGADRAILADDNRVLFQHGKLGAMKKYSQVEGTISINGATPPALVIDGPWNVKPLESSAVLTGDVHVLGTTQGYLTMDADADFFTFTVTPESCPCEVAADVVLEFFGQGSAGAYTWDVIIYDMDDPTTAIITDSLTWENAVDAWKGLDVLTAGIGALLTPGKTYGIYLSPDAAEESTVKKWRVTWKRGLVNQA